MRFELFANYQLSDFSGMGLAVHFEEPAKFNPPTS